MIGIARGALVAALGALLASAAPAVMVEPPLWEDELGMTLWGLSGTDDESTMAALTFAFPYDQSSYNMIYVGANGAIALGGPGESDDYPSGDEFSDTDDPMIAVFWSDLSMELIGAVRFNDFGDRAAITWEGVGTYVDPFEPFTFQAVLHDDGRVVLSFAQIPGIDINSVDTDVHVGLSAGDLTAAPGLVDYSAAPLIGPTSMLEVFEVDETFDLEGASVVLTPLAGGGFDVTLAPEPAALAVLALGAAALARRRR
jgi:MYXO-CTERM domain-containing protein